MNSRLQCVLAITVSFAAPATATSQVERVWLTHRTNDPSRIVVNWTTKTPGDSTVRFGPSKEYGLEVRVPGNVSVHHVEIPLDRKDTAVHYSVSTGEHASADAVFEPTRPMCCELLSLPIGRRSRNSSLC
jgi:hypothetical protein